MGEPWTPIESYVDVLAREAPDFADGCRQVFARLVVAVGPMMTTETGGRAARLITSLSVSDFDDLCRDVGNGSGRAAMRSARTLIEHTINLATVLGSEEDATRYLRHLERGKILLSETPFLSAGLERRTAMSVEHGQRKMAREAQTVWRDALADYGPTFKRQWDRQSLASRSEQHGLDELYEAYRLGSSVTHGSAAGSFGHFYVMDGDIGSFAMGRSAQLVPLALMLGCQAQFTILDLLEQADPEFDMTGAKSSLSSLLGKYYRTIWRISKDSTSKVVENWQAERDGTTAIMTFSRGGRRRWYVRHNQFTDAWITAKENALTRELEESVARLVHAYNEACGLYSDGGWAALELPRIPLALSDSPKSIPADAIYPRLVPSKDFLEWTVIEGRDITGELLEWGVLTNLDGLAEMGTLLEYYEVPDQPSSTGIAWLDLD